VFVGFVGQPCARHLDAEMLLPLVAAMHQHRGKLIQAAVQCLSVLHVIWSVSTLSGCHVRHGFHVRHVWSASVRKHSVTVRDQ
jgi:hypothetical protein